MAKLTLDEVRDIGTAAVRRVVADPSLKVAFKLDFDRDDEPHYSFRLMFPTAQAWRDASARALELTDAVMADLSARDDDTFPFIWLLSDGSWTFSRDAAAE